MTINDSKGIDNNHQISSVDITKIENLENENKIGSQAVTRDNSETGENKSNRDFKEENLYSSRVDKIKKQIEAGEYKISSASIAEKMLSNMEKQRGIDN